MTNIEWVKNPDGTQGITWNPITGCLNHVNGLCKGGGFPCYAYNLAHGRLMKRYLTMPKTIYDNVGITVPNYGKLPKNYVLDPEPFSPRFWGHRLEDKTIWQKLGGVANPKGIFVCDMGDLFGVGIPDEWQYEVFEVIRNCNQHRYYLLTKQPQNLPGWSFPDNCWVGVTATNMIAYQAARNILPDIQAKVKYISFEPLLEQVIMNDSAYLTPLSKHFCDWVIVGACTGTLPEMTSLAEKYPALWLAGYGNKITAQPRIEWVREIVEAADKAGVKVFLKNNLKPLFAAHGAIQENIFWRDKRDAQGFEPLHLELRQEMPE